MSKLLGKIREEFEALLPPVIFFLITFHLVALIRYLMLEGSGIPVSTAMQVTIAALLLGKAVLIADMLPFINRYPQKPLIYNVLWKTVIYTFAATVIRYLEQVFEFWRSAGSFAEANRKLMDEIVWPHFWAIHILLVVLIFSYCTIRELVRVIGRQKAMEMFFGISPPTEAE